mgnify:CR=1 FL=1|tara:strand:+ start:104662 stop:106491 length:1830 start_codon:yes stop_codon:yes gene_type:complete
MCGIAGYKITNEKRHDPSGINNLLFHRGPDHFGHSEIGNYFFATARLKIQDLEGGNQPFISSDKDYVLVYNGELYNKEEIKNLLRGDYQYTSHSDTEIVFYALIEHGIEILKNFNGMFALSFYDLKRNKLFLARDRFGVKPLYFFKNQDDFAFSSEMMTLKELIPYKNLNSSAIKSYLQTNYIHDDTNIFEDCHALKPAEFVELDTQTFILKRRKYWNLEVSENESYNKEKLENLLANSVKRQLISDRPVGVYLSSGIDSATMAFYAKKFLGKVNTYNIAFDHPDFDESPIAEKLSIDLGLDFHKVTFTSDTFINELNNYSKHTSSPIADLGMYPLYYLSQFIKETSTVVLSGDGGDELFGGYPTLKASMLHKKYRNLLRVGLGPARLGLPLFKYINRKSSWDYRFEKFYRGLGYNNNYAHYYWRTVFDEKELTKLGFNSQFDNSLYYTNKLEKYPIPQNYFYADFKVWLVCNNFIKVDIASMSHSIEARVPFLDNDLVDYMFSIKLSEKWDVNSNKKLLRDVMSDKLPQYITQRSKSAFHPPYFKWFAKELYPFLKSNLLNSLLIEKIGLDGKEIESILKNHHLGHANNTYKIFNLLLLEFWLRNKVD